MFNPPKADCTRYKHYRRILTRSVGIFRLFSNDIYSNKGDHVKELTTTKATYRDIMISVHSDRFGGNRVFCCANSLGGHREDKWFPTQGEAIANERHEIDRKLGIPPSEEERRDGRGR